MSIKMIISGFLFLKQQKVFPGLNLLFWLTLLVISMVGRENVKSVYIPFIQQVLTVKDAVLVFTFFKLLFSEILNNIETKAIFFQ